MKRKLSVLLLTGIMTISTTIPSLAETIQPMRYDNMAEIYYCVGKGLNDNNKYIDCTEEAETVAKYAEKWGYFADMYENPKLKEFSDGRLDSIITYYGGHGLPTYLNIGSATGLTTAGRTGYKDINNVSFNTVEFAMLAACHSSGIASIMSNNSKSGKTCTLGWTGEPESVFVTHYVKYFFEGLDMGKTFADARRYARDKMKTHTGGRINNDDIYSDEMFGYSNNTITKLDTRAVQNDNSHSIFDLLYDGSENQHVVDKEMYYVNNSQKYDEIEEYIKENINDKFNIDNYVPSEDISDDGYIDGITFNYKVGDLTADYGYDVLVEGNKVKLITEFGNRLDDEPSLTAYDTVSENYLFDLAVAENGITDKVVKQSITKWFDSKEKKIKYVVSTVYENEGEYAVRFEYMK